MRHRINALRGFVCTALLLLGVVAQAQSGGEGEAAGAPTSSPMTIVQENRMPSYELVKAVYAIDGTPMFTRAGRGGAPLADLEEYNLQGATIAPGAHTLTVTLEYRGVSGGIFSYVDGYRYTVRATHKFQTSFGKGVRLSVIGYDRGGPTVAPAQRPGIRFVEQVVAIAPSTSSATAVAQADAR